MVTSPLLWSNATSGDPLQNFLTADNEMTRFTNEGLNKPSTVIFYNLHGFNQGVSILEYLCDNKDLNVRPTFIFIQENWLTTKNVYKPNKFVGYTFYGCSSMKNIVTKLVLKGLPYGGVGMLIYNDLCPGVTFYTCSVIFRLRRPSEPKMALGRSHHSLRHHWYRREADTGDVHCRMRWR